MPKALVATAREAQRGADFAAREAEFERLVDSAGDQQ